MAGVLKCDVKLCGAGPYNSDLILPYWASVPVSAPRRSRYIDARLNENLYLPRQPPDVDSWPYQRRCSGPVFLGPRSAPWQVRQPYTGGRTQLKFATSPP